MPTERKPWQPPDATEILARWKDCEADMLDRRREYSLNEAFFSGYQWLDWSDSTGLAGILPFTEQAPMHRATVNKIMPRTITYMSRMLASPLSFEPRPEGTDADALRTASLAQQVLEVKHHRDGWEQVRVEEVQHAMFGGVSAVCVEPDWEMTEVAVPDVSTGETIEMPTRPKVRLTALGAMEFGIEPGTKFVEDARWWIRMTTLTPEQCLDRYEELVDPPQADADRNASVMARALLSRRNESTRTKATAVYVYYERPSRRSPGCVMHVINGRIVQQSGWTFPFDHLNVWPFAQTPLASSWKGHTLLTDARPLQQTINRAQTRLNAHLGTMDMARLMVPMGSLPRGGDELSGDAAEVIEFDPGAGSQPAWLQPPQIQRWLPDTIPNMEQQLDDLFSAHAVSRGQAPGDRNSGLALSILAEKDETPLGMMARNQQEGWQKIAEMVLMLEKGLMRLHDSSQEQAYQQAAQPPEGADPGQMGQVIPFPGQQPPQPMTVTDVHVSQSDDGTQVLTDVTWTADDLPDHPVVIVPLDAVMPRSQAAVQDMLMKVASNPAFAKMFANMTPAQLAKTLKVPGAQAFAVMASMSEQEAEWENARMAAGAGDEQVKALPWQDHNVHVVKHNELRASAAYRNASLQEQEFINLHIDSHAKLAAELIARQQAAMVMQQQQIAPGAAPGEPPAEAGPDQEPGAAA